MTTNKIYPIKALEIADFQRQAEILRERTLIPNPKRQNYHLQASSVHFQPKRLVTYPIVEPQKKKSWCCLK